MGARGRRTGTSDRGGLGLFALMLTATCLFATWAVMPPASKRPYVVDGDAPSSAPTTLTRSPARLPSVDALRVHFYDVSEGLAALVDLPGGQHILIDAGDSPTRDGCGTDCATAHGHLLTQLRQDLGGAPIDLLWITHQHSDHIGGARDVLVDFTVREYVDNGRDGARAEVARTRQVARARGSLVRTVDPSHPFDGANLAGAAQVTPVVPAAWPRDCATDPNECSLGLRIDFRASSVLFTGDAERGEERALPVESAATVLQVGHHGSETSSTAAFLARVSPRYAVISAGHPGTGMNADYCLPRAATIERLTRVLARGGSRTLLGYDGTLSCRRSHGEGWVEVPVSDDLWATERDGDVVLTTRGDGLFTRDEP
jgi:competence protein ComEC